MLATMSSLMALSLYNSTKYDDKKKPLFVDPKGLKLTTDVWDIRKMLGCQTLM